MHFIRLILVICVVYQASFLLTQNTEGAEQLYKIEKDINYLTGENLDQYAKDRCQLDIYYPIDLKEFSTVVWFHGGGLTGGNKSIPNELKGQNIAVVAVNYRLSPQVKSPVYIEDAAAAVAWTFKNIGKYNGSTQKIFVSGHSAGGYLTTMIGLDRHYLDKHGINANDIRGLIPLSGQSFTHFTIKQESGIASEQPLINQYAPVFHIRKDASPILIISGDRELEMIGRYEEAAYFWRMLKVVGHPDATLLELDGFNHGEMAKPAYGLLLKFIKQHTDAKR